MTPKRLTFSLTVLLFILSLCVSGCKNNHDKSAETAKSVYDPYREAAGVVVTRSYPDGAKQDVDIYKMDSTGRRTDEVVCHAAYYKDGGLYTEMRYDKGKPDGVWNAYYDDGTPWATMIYEKGLQVGEEKTFFPNGRPRTICTYHQGKIDGVFSEYFESGQLMRRSQFKMGLKIGDEIYYYRNGKICSKGSYDDGVCCGTWTFYDENGRVTRTVVADENTVVCRVCAKCKKLLDAKYANNELKNQSDK